jgi:hypothetical protein
MNTETKRHISSLTQQGRVLKKEILLSFFYWIKYSTMIPSDTDKYWRFKSYTVPSILCFLFVLFHCLFDPIVRQHPKSPMIVKSLIFALFCQMFVYPLMIYYF